MRLHSRVGGGGRGGWFACVIIVVGKVIVGIELAILVEIKLAVVEILDNFGQYGLRRRGSTAATPLQDRISFLLREITTYLQYYLIVQQIVNDLYHAREIRCK